MHCDHIVVRSGTNAARAAKVALLFYDEATQYGQAFPSQSRETDVVVSCFHHFEGPDQRIRRLWSDNAGELVSAGARIRAQRPLAHYVSIPGRPQSNGIIERYVRVVVEGARAILFQSGYTDSWWPFAVPMFIVLNNASWLCDDGRPHGAGDMASPRRSCCTRLVRWCCSGPERSRAAEHLRSSTLGSSPTCWSASTSDQEGAGRRRIQSSVWRSFCPRDEAREFEFVERAILCSLNGRRSH